MLSSHRRDSSFKSSFSGRVHKSTHKKKSSFRESGSARHFTGSSTTLLPPSPASTTSTAVASSVDPNLDSPVITVVVGPSQRLFASHLHILNKSRYLASFCQGKHFEATYRIVLGTEEPEIFSAILEYLYKGDYTPRLELDDKRGSWTLPSPRPNTHDQTIRLPGIGAEILKDTAVYCAAGRYHLPDLKRIALRKQGLQSNVTCSTILSSARYAYENTPEDDSRLRAHYLTLIIRTRHTFAKSGHMQDEMTKGGRMWFDLFIALVNHLDDVYRGR